MQGRPQVQRLPRRPYRRLLPLLLLEKACSAFSTTSAGSALRARTQNMNSTTSRRRSPRSTFETLLCDISRPRRLRRSASSICVTPLSVRSAIKVRLSDRYSLLKGDFTMPTLRLRTSRSVDKFYFRIVQNRLFCLYAHEPSVLMRREGHYHREIPMRYRAKRSLTTTITMAVFGAAIILWGAAQPSSAQTPDGETPAVEDVCALAGLAGALKGLCNAYCEAMDCDSNDPRASARACERVRGNFVEASGGQEPPCVEVSCPCAADWTPFDPTTGTISFLAFRQCVVFAPKATIDGVTTDAGNPDALLTTDVDVAGFCAALTPAGAFIERPITASQAGVCTAIIADYVARGICAP